ncbi:hypothetical protein DOE78_10485 [Bacillus sp. Y1]|nr:diguanylate cyclase [Bacillus sp. Y1]AYA75831.1 hypothetical protein DOE78_10485 [Bacillus sp. Y1]
MKCFFTKSLLVFIFGLFAFMYHQQITYASNSSIVIPSQIKELDVSDKLTVFIDQEHLSELDILGKQDKFIPIDQAKVSGDMSDATYWLKLTISSSFAFNKDFLLELKKPHLSTVTLYSLENKKLMEEETIGFSLPYDNRTIKHHNLVFPLRVQPETSSTYLLKIQSDSFFQAPVSIWDPNAFSSSNYEMQTLHGIFYGIMLAMIIYNSFLFLSLREISYLYYILFIIGFTLMQSIWDGFAFQWLWGDYPWWAMRSNSFFIVWTSLFSLQFAKHFLQLKTHAPLLYKVVSTFIIFCAVALVLPFVLNIRTATMVSTILASIAIIFILAIALKVRFTSRESKYFFSAWSLLLVGVLLNICAAYQLLPLNAVTLYAPKIGILVEVMVLSLGLADKIKRITLEKEQETRNVQTFKQSAMYDHLTNLLNRKYFLESSQETLSLGKGSNQQVSLMLIDIDHFKNINDTYGHTIGDQAIVFVANQIQKVCNNCGIVGRYGGEEFIVFLNQLDLHNASQIAEELIELHRRVPFMLENGHSIYLTLSIGLCSNDFQEYKNVNEMILHADHSLYYAKNNGRDQVAIYG